MKGAWKNKKIGEVTTYSRGLTYSKSDEVPSGGIAVLRANNISPKNGKLNFDEIKYISSDVAVPQNKYVKLGSMLVCMSSGSKSLLGKVALIDEDYNYAFGGFLGQLTPNDEVDSKYLLYILTSNEYFNYIQHLSDGANINNLKSDDLLNFEIPLPPLSEQKEIVAILDKVFAKLDEVTKTLDKQIVNAEELFQSLTNRVFLTMVEQYEQHPLLELTQTITKGSSPKWQGIKYTDDLGLLFITSENVLNNRLDLSNKKYVEPRFNQIEKKAELKKGDVLTNIVGASIGRTAIFDLDESANINQAVCLIRCIPELLDNRYLMFLLNSPFLVKHLHNNEVNNARANLSLTFFRNLTIPLPPLSEQEEIVARLNDIQELVNRMKDTYTHKLTCVEELRKSILDKAFRGELLK